jgi:hypothetical protein
MKTKSGATKGKQSWFQFTTAVKYAGLKVRATNRSWIHYGNAELSLLGSAQAMDSGFLPGRGVRCGCVCEDVAEVILQVPSLVCGNLSVRFLGYALGYFYTENAPKPSEMW